MKEIENTLVEYFDKLHEMGFDMRLEPFGRGYRLVVGGMHIYFENEQLTYTGWGMQLGGTGRGKSPTIKEEE